MRAESIPRKNAKPRQRVYRDDHIADKMIIKYDVSEWVDWIVANPETFKEQVTTFLVDVKDILSGKRSKRGRI